MTISWFGHSCFRIEAKEGSILIDPFDKKIGLKAPKIKDDVVLVTHEHYDHNNLEGVTGEELVVNGPGEYERKGMAVQGISSYHDNMQGSERGFNTIYRITAEDVVLCHLGDLGQARLTDEQVEHIGDVDVLFVPVGGHFTIGTKEAMEVISQIEPKVVVPMHYKIPGLAISELDGPEKFIKEIGLSPEKVDSLKIARKTLPIDEMKLVVFQV
ncbi:MAG: MBL fold metallo-hydrolase [Patescibacteria group bacterium]